MCLLINYLNININNIDKNVKKLYSVLKIELTADTIFEVQA